MPHLSSIYAPKPSNTLKMSLKNKDSSVLAAFYGTLAVVLGAFGAHALEPNLAELGTVAAWKTAVDYQMWHALVLLIVAFSGLSSRTAKAAQVCFNAGIPLFSGSLYWLALGGPRWLGPITPLGGTALIIGWFLLIVAIYRQKTQ
jgi:uncharacterized membrane protein YgdD (TMEM256/DUF423 family)